MGNDKLLVHDLNLWYSDNHALKDINMKMEENKITATDRPFGLW